MISPDEADVGRGEIEGLQRLPELRQVTALDVRKHEVLDMRHADLAQAVVVGQIRNGLHLPGRCISRRAAGWLQRQRHDGVAGLAMGGDIAAHPAREVP